VYYLDRLSIFFSSPLNYPNLRLRVQETGLNGDVKLAEIRGKLRWKIHRRTTRRKTVRKFQEKIHSRLDYVWGEWGKKKGKLTLKITNQVSWVRWWKSILAASHVLIVLRFSELIRVAFWGQWDALFSVRHRVKRRLMKKHEMGNFKFLKTKFCLSSAAFSWELIKYRFFLERNLILLAQSAFNLSCQPTLEKID
jgi:hypothetical protein